MEGYKYEFIPCFPVVRSRGSIASARVCGWLPAGSPASLLGGRIVIRMST